MQAALINMFSMTADDHVGSITFIEEMVDGEQKGARLDRARVAMSVENLRALATLINTVLDDRAAKNVPPLV